jgi:hypothetical protein
MERDSATRFSTSGFSGESVSPKPLSIPLEPFQIFRKFLEILAAQGAPLVSLTRWQMEKILQSEKH